MRGPEDGQVTLLPKSASTGPRPDKGKGRGNQVNQPSNGVMKDGVVEAISLNEYDAWTEDEPPDGFFPMPNEMVYDRKSIDTLRPDSVSEDEGEPTSRVLDVVRIPNSQLRFFPKPHKPPDTTPRHSLETDLRRASLERSRGTHMRRSSEQGPSIQNNLRTLPRPLQPLKPTPPQPKSNNVVRLRPPSAPKPVASSNNVVRLRPPSAPKPVVSSNNLANRLSSLFVVPSPPLTLTTPPRPGPRLSMESRRSSRASSPGLGTPKQSEEALEMHPRVSVDKSTTNVMWMVNEGRKSR